VNNYQHKIDKEIRNYQACVKVHDLPECFHYVSNSYLKQLIQNSLGVPSFVALVLKHIEKIAKSKDIRDLEIISFGSGNCDFEIDLIKNHSPGCHLTCCEINPRMLERGISLAAEAGVSDRISFIETDVNSMKLSKSYDIYIANHSLHHFVGLEHLFAEIHKSMTDSSYFLVHDMIGRNGHMFWDNTLDFCNRIWDILPNDLKYNHQLKQFVPKRVQWDCSREGCEGIRAQDILPLLDRTFCFHDFATFFSIANRFVDRDFGHNYDINQPLHKAILDMIWQFDDHMCRNKLLRPTQMMASMVKQKISGNADINYTYFKNPEEVYMMDDALYSTIYQNYANLSNHVETKAGRIMDKIIASIRRLV
jgi:SAM-dependent methyltransferase